jgi:hypothetical protein
VSGFATGDVSFTGSTAGGTLLGTVTGSGTTYTVAVSGMTGTGTVSASIGAGVATGDGSGLGNAASTSTDNTVTYDITAPTVTIEQAAGQADPTGAALINFTVVFSEAVSGFATGDVSFTGSTAGGTLLGTVTGSGTTYTVAVSGMTGTGTVSASIGAGVATDAAGNSNAASTSTDNTVTYNVPSTVTAWEATVQNPTGSWSNSGFDNRTFRILLKGAAITQSGPTVQVTFRGRTSGNYPIANVSLVQRTGSTLDGEDGTFVPVTFNGGASSVTVNATQPVTSDPIAFNRAAGQAVFLPFGAPPAGGTGGVYRTGGGTEDATWFITGTDQSAVIDWGVLTISGTRSNLYDVELVEVLTP